MIHFYFTISNFVVLIVNRNCFVGSCNIIGVSDNNNDGNGKKKRINDGGNNLGSYRNINLVVTYRCFVYKYTHIRSMQIYTCLNIIFTLLFSCINEKELQI